MVISFNPKLILSSTFTNWQIRVSGLVVRFNPKLILSSTFTRKSIGAAQRARLCFNPKLILSSTFTRILGLSGGLRFLFQSQADPIEYLH